MNLGAVMELVDYTPETSIAPVTNGAVGVPITSVGVTRQTVNNFTFERIERMSKSWNQEEIQTFAVTFNTLISTLTGMIDRKSSQISELQAVVKACNSMTTKVLYNEVVVNLQDMKRRSRTMFDFADSFTKFNGKMKSLVEAVKSNVCVEKSPITDTKESIPQPLKVVGYLEKPNSNPKPKPNDSRRDPEDESTDSCSSGEEFLPYKNRKRKKKKKLTYIEIKPQSAKKLNYIYPCSQCNLKFIDYSVLIAHVRTHSSNLQTSSTAKSHINTVGILRSKAIGATKVPKSSSYTDCTICSRIMLSSTITDRINRKYGALCCITCNKFFSEFLNHPNAEEFRNCTAFPPYRCNILRHACKCCWKNKCLKTFDRTRVNNALWDRRLNDSRITYSRDSFVQNSTAEKKTESPPNQSSTTSELETVVKRESIDITCDLPATSDNITIMKTYSRQPTHSQNTTAVMKKDSWNQSTTSNPTVKKEPIEEQPSAFISNTICSDETNAELDVKPIQWNETVDRKPTTNELSFVSTALNNTIISLSNDLRKEVTEEENDDDHDLLSGEFGPFVYLIDHFRDSAD